MNNNKKYFPVYKGTLADARKELSIDLYLDSKQWNLACKTAIEYILDRNRTTNLKQAVKELLDDFGEDRVVFMIANTVQYYTYEDCFSKENEKWAGEIDIPENFNRGIDINSRYIIDGDVSILNEVVNELLGVTEGYTEEDYKKFKETALVSATAFATNAKEGCENEFALFVETDSDLYLPNLTSYLTFEKGEEKDVITISAANILDEVKDQIKSIEVYYNPHTTKVVSDIENAKYYHIITRKEV